MIFFCTDLKTLRGAPVFSFRCQIFEFYKKYIETVSKKNIGLIPGRVHWFNTRPMHNLIAWNSVENSGKKKIRIIGTAKPL